VKHGGGRGVEPGLLEDREGPTCRVTSAEGVPQGTKRARQARWSGAWTTVKRGPEQQAMNGFLLGVIS
jgi:hypothetical protein